MSTSDPSAASEVFAIGKILCPTDFSEVGLHALGYARRFAKTNNATLHCLHVVDEAYQYLVGMGPDAVPIGPPTEDLLDAAEKQMDAFVAEHLGDAKFPIKTAVTSGRPFMEIIRYAREHAIDMIVIATHGRTGLKHVLLGSVAEKVVRKAPCPVLSIRHPEQKFVMP
jgi:nucleotide-binding universal stress UspA family protein